MSCSHPHHTRLNVSSKSGPARMATVQERFRKELERRFRALRGALRKTLVENDALDLPIEEIDESGAQGPREILQQDALEAAQDFDFRTRSRTEAFMEWWEGAVEEGLLEPLDPDAIGAGQHYSASHVETGYRKGIKWGEARARDFGIDVPQVEMQAVLNRPVHQETLRTLYSRTYGELETMAARAEQDVARILTNEIAAGRNSKDVGDTLANEVRSIQRRDGRRIARSEVMNAQVNATGKRFDELGVEWVNISTVEPCDQCIAVREGGPYPVKEMVAALPVHPNCVCAMIPANPDDDAPQSDMAHQNLTAA